MAALINRQFFSSPTAAQLMTFLDEEDDYWDEVVTIVINEAVIQFHNTLYKRPCRTRPFTGHQVIMDILRGHPDRGYQHFRMSNTIFIRLRDELVEKGLIQGSQNLTTDEQLGIFLFAIGHGVTNRVLAETFQHSGETISRYFNSVLRGVIELRHDYIKMPAGNVGIHEKIRGNPLFHPFKNAVGAIDGTHIPVVVRKSGRVLRQICGFCVGAVKVEASKFLKGNSFWLTQDMQILSYFLRLIEESVTT